MDMSGAKLNSNVTGFGLPSVKNYYYGVYSRSYVGILQL